METQSPNSVQDTELEEARLFLEDSFHASNQSFSSLDPIDEENVAVSQHRPSLTRNTTVSCLADLVSACTIQDESMVSSPAAMSLETSDEASRNDDWGQHVTFVTTNASILLKHGSAARAWHQGGGKSPFKRLH